MIGIIIGLLLLSTITFIIYFKSYNDPLPNVILSGIVTIILFIAVSPVLIPLTGGLGKNYGITNQIGYLTNFSERGVIWKTYEGELQIGASEQATTENIFQFSVTDPKIIEKLKSYLGRKVCLHLKCREWLCMPYSKGSTDREVIGVKESIAEY